MSSDYDIKMNSEDVIEFDTIIKESTISSDPITEISAESSYNMKGIQTHTSIFDPQGSGIYEFDINGQNLKIKVIDSNKRPDTLLYQYDMISDWSQGETTVVDNISSSDMSLSGDFQDSIIGSQTGIKGDGTDDYGLVDNTDIGTYDKFGFATTFNWPSSMTGALLGVSDDGNGDNRVQIGMGMGGQGGYTNSGQINLEVSDSNSNRIAKKTSGTFDNGNTYAMIINKNGNSVSDISFYIDDMSSEVSTTNEFNNSSYNPSNFNQSREIAYFARRNGTSIDNKFSGTIGVFEFNSSPYTEEERLDFIQRRSEV